MRRVTASLALLLLVACGGDGTLVEVPVPPLNGARAEVRERIERARLAVEAASGRPAAERAAAYGELAMLCHAHSLLDCARAAYADAGVLAPDAFRWWHLLGLVERDLGHDEAAVAALERAAALRPGEPATLVRLGELHESRGENEAADRAFETALEAAPHTAAALAGLGRLALGRDDAATAVRRLEAALREAPEADRLRVPLAMAYRGLGDTDRAASLLAEAGDTAPPLDDPWMDEVWGLEHGPLGALNVGQARMREGDPAGAVEAFRAAVAAAPDEAATHANLGHALAALGRLDDARRSLERALELRPDSARAHYDLGVVLARAGQDAEAVSQYRAALSLEPDLVAARLNLANSLRRTGRVADAVRAYHAVVDADPARATARIGEALGLVQLGRFDAAVERLERARDALPDDRGIVQALVRLLAAAPDERVRDGERAVRLARALLDGQPAPDELSAVAMAAAEVGDFASAIDVAGRAVGAGGPDAPAWFRAALAEELRLYREGRPCRRPWRADDPALNPAAAR